MKKFSGVIYIGKKHIAIGAVFLLAITVCIAGYIINGRRDNSEMTANNVVEVTMKKDYIKWVDFQVTEEAMRQAYKYDIESHGKEKELHFVELLAYLGAKYGGDFTRYSSADMEQVASKLLGSDITMEQLTKDMEYYGYYREAYGAVLDGMVGEYQVPVENEDNIDTNASSDTNKEIGSKKQSKQLTTQYGLKTFHPLAKGFPYADYDDFGVSRTYGYKRNHLGHDMMGQVGTPVIAVESGYVAQMGWNQYGGWRIGINSFDGKRYYYYAHLRKDYPFAKWIKKGSVVQAGDVIGYLGRTGYSAQENVNNIDEYHLHFGLQLIFDESQREGNNEIWVNVYPLVKFLYQNQSVVAKEDGSKEWKRTVRVSDPEAEKYKKQQENKNEE